MNLFAEAICILLRLYAGLCEELGQSLAKRVKDSRLTKKLTNKRLTLKIIFILAHPTHYLTNTKKSCHHEIL